jgi:hypothetical protein
MHASDLPDFWAQRLRRRTSGWFHGGLPLPSLAWRMLPCTRAFGRTTSIRRHAPNGPACPEKDLRCANSLSRSAHSGSPATGSHGGGKRLAGCGSCGGPWPPARLLSGAAGCPAYAATGAAAPAAVGPDPWREDEDCRLLFHPKVSRSCPGPPRRRFSVNTAGIVSASRATEKHTYQRSTSRFDRHRFDFPCHPPVKFHLDVSCSLQAQLTVV